jgi:hypothetical protein
MRGADAMSAPEHRRLDDHPLAIVVRVVVVGNFKSDSGLNRVI